MPWMKIEARWYLGTTSELDALDDDDEDGDAAVAWNKAWEAWKNAWELEEWNRKRYGPDAWWREVVSELITFPSQYLHYGVSELTYTTNLGELQEKVFL